MASVKTYGGGKVGTREVDETVLAAKVLGRTLKEVLVMYEANARQGTAKTKERGEISGSNKKPWKQKHTGRARAGSRKSPIWRGGGTVFGPRPRSFYCRVPTKQRRVALASALYAKLRDGEVLVVDGLPSQSPSTKEAYSLLCAVGAQRSALIVTHEHDAIAYRSVRNIKNVDIMPLSDLNARAVLLRQNLVFTPLAFDQLLAKDWNVRRKSGAEAVARKTVGPKRGELNND